MSRMNPDVIVEQAQASLDHKIATVRNLAVQQMALTEFDQNATIRKAEFAAQLESERASIAAAESDALRDAKRAGWTDAELRKFGLTTKKVRRSSRRPKPTPVVPGPAQVETELPAPGPHD